MERRARREKKSEERDSALRVPRAETRLTVYRSIYIIQMQMPSVLPCSAAIGVMRGSNSKIDIYLVENVASTFHRDCGAC